MGQGSLLEQIAEGRWLSSIMGNFGQDRNVTCFTADFPLTAYSDHAWSLQALRRRSTGCHGIVHSFQNSIHQPIGRAEEEYRQDPCWRSKCLRPSVYAPCGWSTWRSDTSSSSRWSYAGSALRWRYSGDGKIRTDAFWSLYSAYAQL